MRRVAAIDVGTNSVRSIVVEIEEDARFRVIDDEKAYTRLGKARGADGSLADDAMERTAEALGRMLEIVRRFEAAEVRAIATAAMREAPNAAAFLERLRTELGLEVSVISEEEEGRLAFLSARANFPLDGVAAVIDLGGGSLEVVRSVAGEIERIDSLPIGAVVLAEAFCRSDPLSRDEFKLLVKHVRKSLRGRLGDQGRGVAVLVGSGGTLTSLAAMTAARGGSPPPSLHGFELTRADVIHLLAQLKRSTATERAKMPGLPESRVDIIVPGTVVVSETMRLLGANRIWVNAKGIREGLVLDMIGPPDTPNDRASRERQVERFAERFHYDTVHAGQVARLADSLFDQLHDDLGLAEEHRPLLRAAAVLHDVGYYVSYERHHKHSHHLIVHSELPGFTGRELRIIAAAARYHRGALPKAGHDSLAAVDERDRPTAVSLAALLRAADGMDRARSGRVAGVRVERAPTGVALVLSATGDGDLSVDLHGADGKADLLRRILGRDVQIRLQTGTPEGSADVHA